MAIDYNDLVFREEVWRRGEEVAGFDPAVIRKDAAGAWMIFDRFGHDDPFGWEIDHVYPKKLLEEKHVDESLWDDIRNLRPMNYANNRSKASSYPEYQAKMKSEGDTNVTCEESFTVNQVLQNMLNQLFGLS
jgi:hypothetical protein